MGVAGTGDVLGRGAEFHGDGRLADHVAGVRAENVHAEHAVGLGVGQNFHESFGGQVHLGAGIGGEGKFSDIVGDAGGFELFFGFADGGDLRIGVNDVRNDVVVHMAGLADEDLGNRYAFLLRLVRQHGSGNGVADRIDAGDVGAEVRIDDDPAAIVLFHADGFEAKTFGVRHAADRHEHDIGVDRLRSAAA